MAIDDGTELEGHSRNEGAEQAEVLAIGFRWFPERLLIDMRADETEGPFAALVPPASSIQERLEWFGVHRHRFGPPDSFGFLSWSGSVQSLRDEDFVGTLRARLQAGGNEAANQFDRALGAADQRERAEIRAAIRGTGAWQTLWERDR